MIRFILLLPFAYFAKTRLKGAQDVVYHAYTEWLAAIIILYGLGGYSPVESLRLFIIGYVAFISLYEIGYLFNDVYASRKEESPRLRMKTQFSTTFVFLFVLIRMVIFCAITFIYIEQQPVFYILYGTLIIAFVLHNVLANAEYKLMTFMNLALVRFYAPFIFFIPLQLSGMLLPAILAGYVLYRTLNYLASKDLLVMKDRKKPVFKISYYAALLPLGALLSYMQGAFIPLLVIMYFMIFWLGIGIVDVLLRRRSGKLVQ